MFLKVIVHSMSSPANMVDSFHCTKTRMVDDMVGEGVDGGARAWAAERVLGGRSWAGSDSCSDVDKHRYRQACREESSIIGLRRQTAEPEPRSRSSHEVATSARAWDH